MGLGSLLTTSCAQRPSWSGESAARNSSTAGTSAASSSSLVEGAESLGGILLFAGVIVGRNG